MLGGVSKLIIAGFKKFINNLPTIIHTGKWQQLLVFTLEWGILIIIVFSQQGANMRVSTDDRKGQFGRCLNTNQVHMDIDGGGRLLVDAGAMWESGLCRHKFAGGLRV